MPRPKRIAERGTIVQAGGIDWLSVTTFNGDAYQKILDIISETLDITNAESGMSRGYEVDYLEGIQWGRGTQENQPHFWIQISGKHADKIMGRIVGETDIRAEDLQCTRIDLQLTVPGTRNKRLAEISFDYQEGKLGEFRGRGRPKVYCYAGDDGDTLYIGSHSSEKFLRIYDKPVIVGGKRHIFERTEVQLRGDKANATFHKIMRLRGHLNRNLIASMIKGYYQQLPEDMVNSLSLLPLLAAYTTQTVEPEETQQEPNKVVQWLLSLEKTLTRECKTENEGSNLVRQMLLKVLVTAATEDNLSSWMYFRLLGPEGQIIEPLDGLPETAL